MNQHQCMRACMAQSSICILMLIKLSKVMCSHWYPYIHIAGSPNCPTVNTTVNTTASLTVSIQKSPMMWLPEWYYVEVSSYFNGSIAEVYNSTLKGPGSFDITPLVSGTVYNISVIPCNVAGCNELCDVHSVQADKEGGMDFMHTYHRCQNTFETALCIWLNGPICT